MTAVPLSRVQPINAVDSLLTSSLDSKRTSTARNAQDFSSSESHDFTPISRPQATESAWSLTLIIAWIAVIAVCERITGTFSPFRNSRIESLCLISSSLQTFNPSTVLFLLRRLLIILRTRSSRRSYLLLPISQPSSTRSTSPSQGFRLSSSEPLFTSNNFPIDESDSRGFAGEDIDELRMIMNETHTDFDEARRILVERRMLEAGVDPTTGLARDPGRKREGGDGIMSWLNGVAKNFGGSSGAGSVRL